MIWLLFGEMLCKSFFEKPDAGVARIENWGDDDLARQFAGITGR